MESFGKFCSALIILFLATIIDGFMYMQLWKWFIAPTFQMTELKLAQAIGLSLFVGFIKVVKPAKDADDKFIEKVIYAFIQRIALSAFVLLIGKIITLFL